MHQVFHLAGLYNGAPYFTSEDEAFNLWMYPPHHWTVSEILGDSEHGYLWRYDPGITGNFVATGGWEFYAIVHHAGTPVLWGKHEGGPDRQGWYGPFGTWGGKQKWRFEKAMDWLWWDAANARWVVSYLPNTITDHHWTHYDPNHLGEYEPHGQCNGIIEFSQE